MASRSSIEHLFDFLLFQLNSKQLPVEYFIKNISLRSDLIEESENLSTSLLATGFFVVHDTSRSSQDNEAELTGWE